MAYITKSVDTRPMSTALMLSKTFARPILLRIVSFVRETSSETASRAVGQMDYAELLEHQKYIARALTKRRRAMSIAKAGAFKCRDIVLFQTHGPLWELGYIERKYDLTALVSFIHGHTNNYRDSPLVKYHRLRVICPLNAGVKVTIRQPGMPQDVHTCRYIGLGVWGDGSPYYKFQCCENCNVGWCSDGFEMGINAQCQFDTRIAPLPLEKDIPCKPNATAVLI